MRITGGVWRSRRLDAPKGDATRPTSDRVREALFSMLVADGVFHSDHLRVLDLYAGTGALAFEALSRGAASAVVVDDARAAVAVLQKNVKALGAERRVEVVAARVDRALARLERGAKFGLVFADPPYADVSDVGFHEVLAGVVRVLDEGGMFVLEHASKDEPPAVAGLEHDRSRTHGTTTLSLYRRSSA
jgi:16S rRNA (guanine966-N2)-methyltransferase